MAKAIKATTTTTKAANATTTVPAVTALPKLKPLATLKLGDWLPGGVTSALRARFDKDAGAAQEHVNGMVAKGAFVLPKGAFVKIVAVRRFGGALSGIVTDAQTDAQYGGGRKANNPDLKAWGL